MMWMSVLLIFYLCISTLSINQELVVVPVVLSLPTNDIIHTVASNSINTTDIDIDMDSNVLNGYDEANNIHSGIYVISDIDSNRSSSVFECSSTPEYHTYTLPLDASWMEYISEVYHEPTTTTTTTSTTTSTTTATTKASTTITSTSTTTTTTVIRGRLS